MSFFSFPPTLWRWKGVVDLLQIVASVRKTLKNAISLTPWVVLSFCYQVQYSWLIFSVQRFWGRCCLPCVHGNEHLQAQEYPAASAPLSVVQKATEGVNGHEVCSPTWRPEHSLSAFWICHFQEKWPYLMECDTPAKTPEWDVLVGEPSKRKE